MWEIQQHQRKSINNEVEIYIFHEKKKNIFEHNSSAAHIFNLKFPHEFVSMDVNSLCELWTVLHFKIGYQINFNVPSFFSLPFFVEELWKNCFDQFFFLRCFVISFPFYDFRPLFVRKQIWFFSCLVSSNLCQYCNQLTRQFHTFEIKCTILFSFIQSNHSWILTFGHLLKTTWREKHLDLK